MAINIKFDLVGNPETPTIILANRNGNKLGQLKVNEDSIELLDKFNDASEISFTINKYINEELTPLWDKIVDFKLIYCKEWDMWFEIKLDLDESTETVKTVLCTQLGQAELSQIMLYNVEINTEDDIARDDYKISILYDKNDPEASILHRVLEKAPHYSIIHVDSTIANMQRSFSFDGTSIVDAFNEIAKEIGCLFVYHSNSDENGRIQRTISVYDLQQKCLDVNCGYRGEFTDKCPKCGSTNIKYGYGDDTLIFVTSDELASSGIQLTTDTDSVKNCFKLEAGDDLMTATVRNCNPNGTDYLWYFSDSLKEDMSDELVEKLDSYNNVYNNYYNDYESNLDANLLSSYNALVDKYSAYNKDLKKVSSPIKGYSNLMNAYYNVIDLSLYLKSGLMPSVQMSETNAKQQASLLTASSLSPVAVNTENINSVSLETANSAVLSMAKIIVKPTYKVEIGTSTLSSSKVWSGNFVVTNYSDEEDTATTGTIKVTINNDTESFIRQKIDKALNKVDTDDYSISGLFEKDYSAFCTELKKYALNPLKSFYDACDDCLNILMDSGAGDEDKKPDLYKKLYEPYYNKSSAITDEIKLREEEIAIVDDEDEGLKTCIEECRTVIQNALDFEEYLGTELWLEFCTYRREDKYSNDNYISDGLNNVELFEKAREFIEAAENEIYKSAELQHSISTTLNNLLAIPKFKPLVESFKTGNWIRVRIDDEIFKLRLLEYGIDYSDFNNITVEFSDVTKIKNGITDIESILSQASSMATSYDAIQKQAKQGNEAQGTIDNWLSAGLNSALVRIQSNDSEDITITKNGILCRSYNDITDTYSPEQLKLTHNIMAYTDDNWRTVKQAIGKHDYVTYNPSSDSWLTDTGYGMSAEFVTAGQVMGSTIVGGEIYSSNYCAGISGNKAGTYINLLTGDFSFGGGKIVNDGNSLILNGVTIRWDTTNSPEITDIGDLGDVLENIESNAKDYTDGMSTSLTNAYKEYADSEIKKLDDAVALHLGINGTTVIDKKYVISPYIGGGYLNITKNNSSTRVIIDPNNYTNTGYIFQVHNGSEITVGIKSNGDASFKGAITATSLTLGSGVKVSISNIDGLNSYALKTELPTSVTDLGFEPSNVIYKGDITQSTKTDSNGLSYVETVVPSSNGQTIKYSTYDADDYIVFGREKGTDSVGKNYICIDKDGLLTARNALIYGTIYATDGEFAGKVTATEGEIGGCEIKDGVLKITDANITSVSADQITAGTLSASDSITLKGLFTIYKPSSNYIGGYIGYGEGDAGVGIPMDGIALYSDNFTNYVIATSAGVRMQSSSANMYVKDNEAVINGDVYINGVAIDTYIKNVMAS